MIRRFWKLSFAENGNKRFYYSCYTIMFLLTAFFCFSWFVFSGKSLIWEIDGWSQHFRALVYYSKYLKQIFRHLLFDHKLVIPDWDFYIGEGTDIVNALHYYVIGDPLAFFSVLVPTKYLQYFFSFSCVFRLYLAGISFSTLCFGTKQENRYGIMAGSIAYDFCYWALMGASRHPYFLNPMIYFPMMILGIEKILKKEKPYLFIVSVTISAVSNFYFFYIIVMLTIGYTMIRLGFIYRKRVINAIKMFFYIGIMSIIGTCMAGILLIPVTMMFLNDSRLSVSQPFHLFYSLKYYSLLPSLLLSGQSSYWLCVGIAAPVVLALLLLFLQKKDIFLKVLLGLMIVIILLPICGRFLNGMSYMSNRWSWAFSLLSTYILVRKWDDLFAISDKQWKLLVTLSGVYYAACLLLNESRDITTLSSIPLLFIALIIIKSDAKKNDKAVRKQILLLGIVIFSVINISFWKYSPDGENYISEFKENRNIWKEWEENEASAVKSISTQIYTRMSGDLLSENANMLSDISSTQYYWSISNPYMNNFRSELSMREPLFSRVQGYDNRTAPMALSAVRYYSSKNKESNGMPYGYTLAMKVDVGSSYEARIEELKDELGVEELSEEQKKQIQRKSKNEYYIYENEYALPIAYCYDRYFTKEMWDAYNPVQKQEAQLQAVYMDDVPKGIEKANLQLSDYLVGYDVEYNGMEISQDGKKIITTANNAQITLSLHEKIAASETYIGFKGLEFVPTARYDLYFGDDSVDPLCLYNKTNWNMLSHSAQTSIRKEKIFWNSIKDVDIAIASSGGTKNSITYKQPESGFSSGRHDYIANLGYLEDEIITITITFPTIGIYSFDSMDVYRIPMDGFADKIEKLQSSTLNKISFGTDRVSGEISLDRSKILCLAIPFSKGWRATIDGEKTEVKCLNDRYLGIVVPAGEHRISFSYCMPYKKAGMIVSIIGFVGFAIVICLKKRKVI